MSPYDFCGLDFGTSNSTIGIFDGRESRMVNLEEGKPTLRSAIFFDYDTNQVSFGQQGISQYLSSGHGRLMMSLKSILGSSLMEEKTLIDKKLVSYTDILECLIRYIKHKAENQIQQELTKVVLGRPVRFHDYDDKCDTLAEKTLEKVAKNVGFKTVIFQFEPIAAAIAYENNLTKDELALIVDLGGGTSDFTVIQLKPNRVARNTHFSSKKDLNYHNNNRQQDVLANKGIHIGGTDLDKLLSLRLVMPHMGLYGNMRGISGNIVIPSSYYHDLTTWHTINSLYTYKTKREIQNIYLHALEPTLIQRLLKTIEKEEGHKIQAEVEKSKCFLSNHEAATVDLNFIEEDFVITIFKKQFEEIIQSKIEDLITTIQDTIQEAGIKNNDIDSIFFTGGTTQIPLVQQKIRSCFPDAHFVQGDVFSSVGKGLILEAKQRFGE